MDKTGTITEGRPEVTGVQWLNNDDASKDILLSIEKQSEHPLAEAVVKHLDGAAIITLTQFDSITGKGAKADHNNETYFVGNKKLLAEHGNEIFAAAAAKNVMVMFEAAVAGGIPIIKSLREGLAANKIEWIAGIINGTSNFILSEMRSKGSDFADVLKEAQAKGYAEADPTFDIEGHDAGHKITIMSSVAFGVPLDFSKCYLEGISTLEGKDIQYAEELGYRVKLLGITRRREDGVELRVDRKSVV